MTANTAVRPASSRPAGPKGESDLARRAGIRGKEFLRKGQATAAREQFLKAVRAEPRQQLYWLLLAQCEHKLGQPEQAIQHLGRAWQLQQSDAEVCLLLADFLLEAHRNSEALVVLDGLQADVARSGKWYLAKAKAQLALLDFDGTVRSCSEALTRAGQDPILKKQALQGMGHGLMKFGGHAEAAWCYRMLLDDNPLDFGAALCAAHASSWACDWAGLAEDFERLRLCIAHVETTRQRPVTGKSPFPLITLTDDPVILKWAAGLTYQEHCAGMQPVRQRSGQKVPRPDGKLRIGLMSSDFHVHATSILMAEFLEGIDTGQFALYFYSGGPDDHSALRARVQRTAACWIETGDLSSVQLAERIRADQIGLLLDLKGYTLGSRMDVLAYRPAPIQIAWLGFPGTAGAPSLDYFIGDPVTTPMDAQPHFTECIAQMPHCYQPNDSTRARPAPVTRAQCGLPEDATFVFASFNMAYKIVPEVFAAWCHILEATPGSVLWLLVQQEPTRERLRAAAVQHGLDPDRLVFAPFLSGDLHRSRLPLADLCLDTFPCGGHTTASDALWAGVPVLALMGQSFASRVAGSLLHALDLPDLACTDIDQYIQRAIALAQEPARFQALKARLELGRTQSTLFDGRRFARDFEQLLLRMVARQDAGLPPAPLAAAPGCA